MTDHGKIIDLRCRPPAVGFETTALYWDKDRIAQMGRDIGFEPAPSYTSGRSICASPKWTTPVSR